MKTSSCDYKHLAIPLAMVFSAMFVVAYFWGYTTDDPAVRQLHLNLLKLVFLGFNGINGLSFFLGLVQSFIWGLVAAAIFYLGFRHSPCDSCNIDVKEKE